VLLLGLYFLGRLVVLTAVVNATLWERRTSSAIAGGPHAGDEKGDDGHQVELAQ
jgi:hypothetical protein